MAKTKQKPRLHLVRGDRDPELYSGELDWYFGCFDSVCGLASISTGDKDDVWIVGGPCYRESNWYTDAHVTFRSAPRYPGAFTKARRIWGALERLPYRTRLVLRQLYEPRQWFPPGWVTPTDAETRGAHGAYYEARRAGREAA